MTWDYKIFLSHSSADKPFVEQLRQALERHNLQGWLDARELRGSDPLRSGLFTAIEQASAYLLLVSTASLQSEWVTRELQHAQKIKNEHTDYPLIPLLLDGTKLGAFSGYFPEQPLHIPVSSQPGGIEEAVHAILAALGKRLPNALPVVEDKPERPLAELLLKLSRPALTDDNGVQHARAEAELVYVPSESGKREVASVQRYFFRAPLGLIEAEELRWYLEEYYLWPAEVVRYRARKIERDLIRWGQALYQQALPVQYCANALQGWQAESGKVARRFSVWIDDSVLAGSSKNEEIQTKQAATTLLSLPWELLHDGNAYLFQGAKPVRVRRRLPNTLNQDVLLTDPPIRVLLVTARPEDQACGYIDHRASAMPLVQAIENLDGLVELKLLDPPTFAALQEELDRTREKPYHIVHFDGHGVYSPDVGLGGLCFEHPGDTDKLEKRRHEVVYTDQLGPIMQDHRIPLFFLEACQTAQAEKDPTASVAAALLQQGVASVVAMSHSVLVETARRFVEKFYAALAEGERVGDAMLAGQKYLKDDTRRGATFVGADLTLEDWFVPVLFQEQADPQLFRRIPTRHTQDTTAQGDQRRFGKLPAEPETGFIGRSRELLKLQRLLRKHRYAVVRGIGGEGKTP